MSVIESERLYLRPFTLDHADFIVALVNSPGWLQYIGDRNIRTRQQAIDYLNNGPLRSYSNNEFGLRLVILKSNGVPVGMCGLLQRDYMESPDIGFAFLPQYHGFGYAYEIAAMVLKHVLAQPGQTKISAITKPANKRSIRLLEKLGLRFSRMAPATKGTDAIAVYEINRTPATEEDQQ